MTDVAQRYRKVAADFTRRAEGVAPHRWDDPAPCDGWVARDVVRHMVEWMPALVQDGTGIVLPAGPAVDDDPAGAWHALDDAIQALLDDPAVASSTFSHPRAGEHPLDQAIATFILGDVLVHTWDLARATGQDEALDPDEVHEMLIGVLPMDQMLRGSGHYGPRVEVPAGADEQTQLIAFLGRQP